ncbi:MAG: rod shape-determining protein [Clostridia bacterium]|nr:rod shape-determining protein [Clostridia bacterium]
MADKFAIDFDSSFTNIYKLGSGLVLSEPTVAAVDDGGKGSVKAIGLEANKLIGKTTKNTKTVFPVFEGEIVNERIATELLSGFMKKVSCSGKFFSMEGVFSVPCGIDSVMLEKYRKVAKNCGFTKVSFIEAPLLSALGQRIPLSDSKPFFVIDMAGGTTNIAAVSLDGVIAGVSVNFGSNVICADIIDFVAEKFGLQIGLLTAEKLKNEIGSLDICDGLSTIINGRNIKTGTPMALTVKAMELFEPVSKYFDKIAEISLSVLKKLPPEVSAEIRHSGIYISGISSTIYGLASYYKEKFDMEINLADNGLMCVALGGGAVLANPALKKKLALTLK